MRKPVTHCTRWLSTNGKGGGVVAPFRALFPARVTPWAGAGNTASSASCPDRQPHSSPAILNLIKVPVGGQNSAATEVSASPFNPSQKARGTRYDSSAGHYRNTHWINMPALSCTMKFLTVSSRKI